MSRNGELVNTPRPLEFQKEATLISLQARVLLLTLKAAINQMP
jgi:hypothetical protein